MSTSDNIINLIELEDVSITKIEPDQETNLIYFEVPLHPHLCHLTVPLLILFMTIGPRRSWIFLCMERLPTYSTESATIAFLTAENVSLKPTRFCHDMRIPSIGLTVFTSFDKQYGDWKTFVNEFRKGCLTVCVFTLKKAGQSY